MPRLLPFALVLSAGCATRVLVPIASPPETPHPPFYNAAASVPDLGAFEQDLLGRVGLYRQSRAEAPLALDGRLCVVAREYARELLLRSGKRPPAPLIDFLL